MQIMCVFDNFLHCTSQHWRHSYEQGAYRCKQKCQTVYATFPPDSAPGLLKEIYCLSLLLS